MDMLIKLYELPPLQPAVEPLSNRAITVRRAMAYERSRIMAWTADHFNPLWADECAVAFGRQPIGCFIAAGDDGLIGFCCMESTYRNFIGPVGISDGFRGLGVGRALVLTTLWQMRHQGYAYAVVGDVGQPGFFEKTARAVEIEDSTPGSYPPRMKPQP